MANKDGWNKCWTCGKYVSIDDMDTDKAFCGVGQDISNAWGEIWISDYTEVYCPKCYAKQREQQK